MPNIILIGFMGTGKTTVGKIVAQKLGLDFIDTDKEIVSATGLSIVDIFQRYGEIRFRSEESAAVRRIAEMNNKVVATGGGVVLNSENIEVLRENGIIIALESSPEVILERISRKNTRPLLQQGNPLETIKKLQSEREALYKQAPNIIETSYLTLDEVVSKVIELYREEVLKWKS